MTRSDPELPPVFEQHQHGLFVGTDRVERAKHDARLGARLEGSNRCFEREPERQADGCRCSHSAEELHERLLASRAVQGKPPPDPTGSRRLLGQRQNGVAAFEAFH